jgi:integrase
MRVKLTPAFVAKAPKPEPPKDRIIHWDGGLPGFGLMVTAGGHASYVCQYRAGRRSHRMSLKSGLTLQDARREAKKLLGDVARGDNPLDKRRKEAAAATDTFGAIAEEYITREGKSVRSMKNREATLRKHVFPTLERRPIAEIKRTDIVRLLDRVEDKFGPSGADNALRVIRRVMSWHASRSDDFRSPIVRGMARTKPKERARQRILTDDELRAVWAAAEASTGLFGPFVQFLLLTAARRTEAAQMTRSEVVGDVWSIPQQRYKTGLELVLPLSPLAARALSRLPAIGDGKIVFTTDGKHPFSGYSKAKAKFDKECGVTGWTLHDLRRTARSLMSRAGVSADVAERCLGHVIAGVRGTYDRYAYLSEKRQALEALATLIERILEPQGNVIAFKAG